MICRFVGTVSSREPSIRASTRMSDISGSHRSIGSSRPIRPSSTSARVAAPVIGLVVEEIRNKESRRIGRPSIARRPRASTWTWSPRATSATKPGAPFGPM